MFLSPAIPRFRLVLLGLALAAAAPAARPPMGPSGAPGIPSVSRPAPPVMAGGRLLLFHDPADEGSARMEAVALAEPPIAELVRGLGLVRVNIREQRDRAARAGVTATPAFVVIREDGTLSPPIPALMPAEMLRHSLEMELFAAPPPADPEGAALGVLLRKGSELTAEEWRRVLRGLGAPERRRALLAEIHRRRTFSAARFVELLADDWLAVRVAALELLEERSGDAFGYDPWADRAANEDALERWGRWAQGAATDALPRYAALTDDRIEALLQDVLGDAPERRAQALRRLRLAGASILPAIEDRIAAWPDPDDGRVHRLRELRYSILLPDLRGRTAAHVARQLVVGTLDEQTTALRALGAARRGAEGVLKDYLAHESPLAREAAVESLFAAARRNAVAILREHLPREKNTDVLYAILLGLGRIPEAAATETLLEFAGHEREDLAIAALRGLGRGERAATPAVATALRTALEDPRWRVRVSALETIADRRVAALAAETERALADTDEFARHMAVKAVAALNPDRASVRQRLEQLFIEEDGLKVAVAEAFLRMRRRWPASFAESLLRAGADTALPVIGVAAGDAGARPTVLALTGHRDEDVRCAAWSALARYAADETESRRAMVRALREGTRAEGLAILQHLQLSTELRRRLAPARATVPGLPPSPAPSAEAPGDLMDAFFGAPATAVPAAPATAAEPSATVAPATGAAEVPDELLDAFFGTTDPAAPSASAHGGSVRELREAVLAVASRWPDDEDLARAALLARMTLCDPDAPAEIARQFAAWPRTEQMAVAGRLPGYPLDGLRELLPRLLRSPSARLRVEAAEYLTEHAGLEGFRHIADEMAQSDARLNPWDIRLYRLDRAFERISTARNAAEIAAPLLRNERAPVRVFGVLLLNTGWRRGESLPSLQDVLADEDSYVRRIAWQTLALREFRAFVQRIEEVLSDPADGVREVVPFALSQFRVPLRLRYDAEHDDYYRSEPTHRLDAGERGETALRRLARDPVSAVRVRAFAALVALRKPFPVSELAAAVDACDDDEALEALRDVLWESLSQLGPEFALLADFMAMGRRGQEDLSRLTARFPPAPAAVEGAYVRRPAAASGATATFLPEAAPTAARTDGEPDGDAVTALIEMVLFYDPACPDCEDVERWLAPLIEQWGSVRVERLDLREPSARRLNAELGRRYGVPSNLHGVAPSVFASRGALVGREITFETLSRLMERSAGVPMEAWREAAVSPEAAPPGTSADEPAVKRSALARLRHNLPELALLIVLPILLVGLGVLLRRLHARGE